MSDEIIIGVDVDDVSVDLMPAWLQIHNTRTGDTLAPEMIKSWGVHRFTRFEHKVYEVLDLPEVYDSVNQVEGAREGLRTLRSTYRVVFVTANAKPSLEAKGACLVRHGLVAKERWRKDIIVMDDKSLAPCHLLIDDKVENIEAFPGPAILFDRPWNSEWTTPRERKFPVVRVHGWTTIPSFVDVLVEYSDGKIKGRWE